MKSTCDALWASWTKKQKKGKIDADIKVCCNVKPAAAHTDKQLTKPETLAEECRVFKKK